MDRLKVAKDGEANTSVPQEEAKVISEIRIVAAPSIDRTQQFIEDYSTCCLCGSELDFTHVTHFLDLQVEEEASCPSCRIRHKQQSHILH